MPTRLGPFLLLFIGVIQVEAEYCSLYTECVAVARLEERLCLGNSRKRPFWLPQLNDPHECHEKLKADYKRLELLEVELDSAFTSCTLEKNGTQNENASCSRIAENTPKFVRGRTIDYVPTHCFSGIDARTTRQCGPLKRCCSSVIGCESILSSSPEYDRIKAAAFEMRKRANDCERGLEIPPLAEYRSTVKKPNGGMEDEKKEKSILTPSGTITITVTDISTTPASTATATTEKSESNPEEHEATTVTTSPIRVDAEESANRTSYNDLNTAIFDHLDKHEKQVKEMLEKEGQPVHPSTTPEPEFLDQPHLSFPTGTTGKGSASSEVQVPASGDKVEEAEADFGLSIGRGQSSDDTLIDQTLSSLFKAAEVPSDESRLAGDTVRSEARFTEGENGQAESPLRGVVTSAPMILIPDNSDGPRRAPIPSTNCGLKRLRATKSFKMEKILNLLGENQNSDDMQEIRGLLDNWQNEVRATLLDAKRRNKNRAIDQALDKLIDHFDTVNIGLLKESANANFEESEYPDEDAQIAAMECEPIGDEEGSGGDRIDGSGSTETPVEGSGAIEGSGTEQPTTGEPTQWTEIRRTENGDKIVVDGGVEKIVFGDGSLQIDNKANVTDTDEAPVNTEWMQRYRAEVERLHKDREDEFGGRNESSCDLYMRCRNQMHLALDGCAWRFASVKILMSLAESSESLLYRGDDLCDPSDRPFYESLYELMIKRNGKIRECLEDKNKNIFDKAVCIPYPPEKSALYDDALLRILSVDYPKSAQCFGDANLIQEKCSRLRECCPHFDRCREDSLDIALEQAILSKTAQVNERKQYCLRSKARTNFKQTLRDLLGKGSWKTIEMIRNGEIGAKVGGFDRLRYRKVYRV
ncbi:unnamed protein product, partial [Mesorhabditis belari]|uniref:Uncharacterized protein n=1 Tax=Mesorhabditis belari TaxID=2138241 RepID=A0AAF3J6G3_9BILA